MSPRGLLRRLAGGTGLFRGLTQHAGRLAGGVGRLPLRWRVTSVAVLAVLAAAAAVTAARLAVHAQHDDAVAQASTAAMAAAKTELPQILSYDYRSISSDLATARGDTTGQFRGEFNLLASQLISPEAGRQHTVTRATVPDASVVRATADQVVVLLFIDQSTTSEKRPQPQQEASQIRVTMERSGGRWLVSQFQAL